MIQGFKTCFLALLVGLAGLSPALASTLDPFEARYAVYRNGKLIGSLQIRLDQKGGRWSLSSESSGTHGLARIMRAKDSEFASGFLDDGRFIPEQYRRHTRMVGMEDRWSADFDWQQGQVHVSNEDGELQFSLERPALDPLSMGLELRQRLAEANPDLLFHMVDDNRLKDRQFRRMDHETLETSLGCLDTLPVERVKENSKRYTRIWHAPELEFISVRMEHGKTGGNHMELRITELALNGRAIDPSPACSAGHRPSP